MKLGDRNSSGFDTMYTRRRMRSNRMSNRFSHSLNLGVSVDCFGLDPHRSFSEQPTLQGTSSKERVAYLIGGGLFEIIL